MKVFWIIAMVGMLTGTGYCMSFEERCQQPGVERCFGFDSESEIQPFIYSGTSTPAVDTDVKASGDGAILFTIPSNSPANTSGGFSLNFTPGSQNYSDTNSYPVQFGEGEEFYVQWRQRFTQEFITRYYQGGGGWKQAIIGTGDRPGEPAYSCTQLEVVVQNNYYRGFAAMYHSCGVKDGQYEGLDVPTGNYDYKLQNAVEGCNYQLVSGSSSRDEYIPPCIGYKADQWMTFQVHVKIGTWYKNDEVYHEDSRIRLWVAEEGQPSTLVIDRNPNDGTGYDLVNVENINDKYGKIWLLPYNTGKDETETHPETYTWYDELIISRERIPDPGASSRVKEGKHESAQNPELTCHAVHAESHTMLSIHLPRQQHVRLQVLDLDGRVVRNLMDAKLNRGHHDINCTGLGGGVYLARLQIDGKLFSCSRIMVGL
jgi:hypothetical protein